MNEIKNRVHNDFLNLKEDKEGYFRNFYTNNYNLIYKISFSILKDKENSEDVTQNVFEKIYKLPNEKLTENFESTWLYTVTKNEAIQYIKKNKYSLPLDENYDVTNPNCDYDEIEGNEEYNKIVKKLNKKQEQIVSLKVLSDFTFKEIGELLSIPTATVQWHYYKSIKSLKIALGNMAMFIISIFIGLKNHKIVDDKPHYYEYKKEENSNQHIQSDSVIESTDVESTSKDQGKIGNSEVIEEVTQSGFDESSINNSYNTIFISLATIFLVISIIFSIIFIKSQQKLKIKSSKK